MTQSLNKKEMTIDEIIAKTMSMSYDDFPPEELIAVYQWAQSNRMFASDEVPGLRGKDVLRHRQFRCVEMSLEFVLKQRGIDVPPPIEDFKAHICEAIESNTYGYHERKAAREKEEKEWQEFLKRNPDYAKYEAERLH